MVKLKRQQRVSVADDDQQPDAQQRAQTWNIPDNISSAESSPIPSTSFLDPILAAVDPPSSSVKVEKQEPTAEMSSASSFHPNVAGPSHPNPTTVRRKVRATVIGIPVDPHISYLHHKDKQLQSVKRPSSPKQVTSMQLTRLLESAAAERQLTAIKKAEAEAARQLSSIPSAAVVVQQPDTETVDVDNLELSRRLDVVADWVGVMRTRTLTVLSELNQLKLQLINELMASGRLQFTAD